MRFCVGADRRLSPRGGFEDFSCCWPEDVLKAKGAASEVRRIVNVKD